MTKTEPKITFDIIDGEAKIGKVSYSERRKEYTFYSYGENFTSRQLCSIQSILNRTNAND